jgi:single-stranded-DNA-specific exonuclease
MPNETELLELLLKNRGISKDYRDKFLNPLYEDLYDPFLLKDMERACVRIFEAIEAKEKIVIYSDYDCDGIPSAVILSDFFKKAGCNFEVYPHTNFNNKDKVSVGVYIPHRHDEGYGLHHEAVEEFIKKGVNLLITLDLGITAVDEVATAQTNGVEVIIIDHHLPNEQEELPRALAIINPKQKDCSYPDKMLCASGLTFKLIQGLIKKYGGYWKISEGWEKWALDMVGIATLSDQVPLLDENRIFAFYGLKVLRKTRRPGLVEIFLKAGVDISKLSEEDVTFTLAPRINAASRMDDPIHAFNMLATSDIKEAKTLADHLVKINNDRKYIVAHIMKDVKAHFANLSEVELDEKKIIVVGNPKWRVGVLGIVASKIVDEYKKPTFVWGKEGGEIIKGSCRSYGGINLVDLMTSLPENSLLEFGGHAGAGGFSVSHEEIHFLEERLSSVFQKNDMCYELNASSLEVDTNISIDDVTVENYKIIEMLAPYGAGNPKPTFLLKNIKIDKLKEFGKEKNHLELSFLNNRGRTVKAIAFFKTKDFKEDIILKEGDSINLIATFEKNNFGGKSELRLRIVDIL